MEDLEFALRHCHSSAHLNKRRVLAYLIPIKLVHGVLPSRKLLEDYQFSEFT